MTTATIAEIYDAIKHCNGEYCSICFCPSSERRLVTPSYIKQLRYSVKFAKIGGLQNRELKVCYICEAMAARAVKFQQVVTLAASVEAMLTWMTDEIQAVMIQQKYFPNMNITQEMKRTILNIKEVEAALQNTSVPQLGCSQVLVVGSNAAPVDSSTNTSVTRLHSTGPIGTRPHNDQPIIVEDDPPPRGRLVHVTNAPLQLQVKENATGTVVMHPIIIGTNKKMYVPSLKVEVKNERLRHVSDAELFKYANIPIPPPSPPPPPLPLPLEPVPRQTNDTNQTKQKNSTMLDNYVDFVKQQRDLKDKFKNKDPSEQDENEILNKKARVETSNKDGVSNEIKNGEGDVIKPVRTYATKKPVLQMHKVLDWEDKIPMDVISFMDATDPNPNERIMQPNQPVSPPSPTMGVISDVRTIDDNENNAFNGNENNAFNGNENNMFNVNENNAFNGNVNNVFNGNEGIFGNENDDNDVVLVENIECIDLC